MTEPTETVHDGDHTSESSKLDNIQVAEAPTGTSESAPEDTGEPEPSPNSEAARWRTKLRETETQLGALTDRLTAYQRRECEQVVSDLLDEPGDMWEIGQAKVTEFYNDDGELDEAILRAAAGALCEMRPKLAKPQGPRWQNFGQGSTPPPQPVGWESVLKG